MLIFFSPSNFLYDIFGWGLRKLKGRWKCIEDANPSNPIKWICVDFYSKSLWFMCKQNFRCGYLLLVDVCHDMCNPFVQWKEKEANNGGNTMRAKLGGEWNNLTSVLWELPLIFFFKLNFLSQKKRKKEKWNIIFGIFKQIIDSIWFRNRYILIELKIKCSI